MLTDEQELELMEMEIEIFNSNKEKKKQESVEAVSFGPSYVPRTDRAPGEQGKRNIKAKKVSDESHLAEHLPNVLGGKVDLSSGADFNTRSYLAMYPTMEDRRKVLIGSYGEGNVKSLVVSGEPQLLFKDKKSDKWKFVDLPFGIEFADVTADLVGEVVPTLAGIAGTVQGLKKGGLIKAAAFGSVAYGAAGVAQDAFVRGVTPEVDVDFAEIAKRRPIETAFNFGLDLATGGVGKFFTSRILRKEGTGIAHDSIVALEKDLGMKFPAFMKEGESSMTAAADIATTRPESAVADFLTAIKDNINRKVSGQVEPESNDELVNFARKEVEKSTGRLNELKDKVSSLKRTKEFEDKLKKEGKKRTAAFELYEKKAKSQLEFAKEKAIERTTKVMEKEVQLASKAHVKAPSKPMYEVGSELQQARASHFIKETAKSDAMYGEALAKIGNTPVPVSSVVGAFNGVANKAVRDSVDELVIGLASTSQKYTNRAISGLKDIDSLSFGEVDNLRKSIGDKAGFGGNRTQDQIDFGKVYANLDSILLEMAAKLGDDGKLYTQAKENFKKNVLPLQDNDSYNLIKPRTGEFFSDHINRLKSTNEVTFPNFESDAQAIIEASLKTKASVEKALRASGGDLNTLQSLRNEFLRDKGITSENALNANTFKIADKDEGIVTALWPAKAANGKNLKLESFKQIQKVIDRSLDSVNAAKKLPIPELAKPQTQAAEKELAKMTADIAKHEAEMKQVTSTHLMKMWNKGEIPTPENRTIMETFMAGIRGADNKAQDAFVNRLKEEGKGELLAQATIHDLLVRSGQGTRSATRGSGSNTLWNRSEMNTNLEGEKAFLVRALGKERYDNLKKWNESLSWLEGKDLKAEARASATANAKGKAAIYWGNMTAATAVRFKSAMLYNQLKNPVSFKVVKSAEDYDKIMNRVIMSTLISKDGIQAIANEAEADPEFKANMAEFYSEVFQGQ